MPLRLDRVSAPASMLNFRRFPADWHALDKNEGATGNNPGYDRAAIQVHTDSGNRDVTTYLARRGRIDESLKPYTWYLELIRCGAEQHGLPEDYRQTIENTMDIPDPDENRRAKRGAEAQIREYRESIGRYGFPVHLLGCGVSTLT